MLYRGGYRLYFLWFNSGNLYVSYCGYVLPLLVVFSILPIVTPPFVVGLGVILMVGRSYVTEFRHLRRTLENQLVIWFTGIWLAQVLAFTQCHL